MWCGGTVPGSTEWDCSSGDEVRYVVGLIRFYWILNRPNSLSFELERDNVIVSPSLTAQNHKSI